MSHGADGAHYMLGCVVWSQICTLTSSVARAILATLVGSAEDSIYKMALRHGGSPPSRRRVARARRPASHFGPLLR